MTACRTPNHHSTNTRLNSDPRFVFFAGPGAHHSSAWVAFKGRRLGPPLKGSYSSKPAALLPRQPARSEARVRTPRRMRNHCASPVVAKLGASENDLTGLQAYDVLSLQTFRSLLHFKFH